MKKRSIPLAAVAAFAIALAGCGGSSTTVSVVTSTTTTTAAQPTTSSTTSTASTTQPATTTPTQASGPALHLTAFSSPSGNIGCYLDSHGARCDIKDRSWQPPPKPASCPVDWGQGVEVTGGSAGHIVCAGDTALGAKDQLAYGSSSAAGSYRCSSAETGMTCTDTATGHGFFISRDSYKLF
jgi:hypothetical protein